MHVINIDFNSDEAIYVQLINQIILGIATSKIQEGDYLPSVRELAEYIGINMHTVNKAYSILKQEGYVKLDRRRGAIIAIDIDKMRAIEDMKEDLRVTIAKAICKNISCDEAIKVARVHNSDIIIATDPDADRVGVCVRTKDGKYQLLSGNQVGAILIYYIVNNKRFDKTGMVITTIVTSDIGERIAKAYDLEVKRTLTGFKFIGEQMKLIENSQDYEFAFGYEESIGYIVKDIVRDKDALQSVVCILEAASYYLYQGKTLLDVLNEIYEKFGYFYDEVVNINLVGYEGSKKISNILNYFRNHYQELNLDFIIHEDYLTQIRYYTNQEEQINLPKSNVLKFYLPDGSWFAMRPSGTEPKMKIYLSIIGKTMNEAIDKANSIKQIILEKINLI